MEKLIANYKFIFSTINNHYKLAFVILFIGMIFTAVLEVGSIASLVPFLQELISIDETRKIIFFDDFFSNDSFYQKNRFFVITAFFILFIILSSVIKLIQLKLVTNFIKNIGHFFASKIFNKIISLSYDDFTGENSSNYLSIIENKVDRIVDIIFHTMEVLSSLIILLFIFVALTITNYQITLTLFAFFFICYISLFKFYKKKLVSYGIDYTKGLSSRVKITQELFGSFRLLKIEGDIMKSFFSNRFDKLDHTIRSSLKSLNFVSSFPRFIIEGIAIIMIAILAFVLIKSEIYDKEMILISLGIVGFSAQKILPLIQKIYYSSSQILAQKEAAYDAINFLLIFKTKENYAKNIDFIFKDKIVMKNISFSYKNIKETKVLNNVNLQIKKGSKVCILGQTGSGKSTIVDLLAGLLKPDKGNIIIDDYNIENIMKSWHNQISYVPQHTFLTDSTILENVAFGINPSEIDAKKVDFAIEQAGIKSFTDNLPDKLLTKIGERGILLSGGQIQRLGLARAFYKNFEVLIMDESTNALDASTENYIYSNIEKNLKNKTIFTITHKSYLAKNADIVLHLDDGNVNIEYKNLN